MEQTKRKSGRPRGAVYPRRLSVYDTDEGIELLQELARRRGASAAALVRQLVREEAARATARTRTRDLEFAWGTFLARGMQQGHLPESDPQLLTRAALTPAAPRTSWP